MFFVRGRGGGGPQKLVRIMLETWNMHVSKHRYVVSENISFSTKALLILQKQIFGKNSTFTQSNSVRAVLEIS